VFEDQERVPYRAEFSVLDELLLQAQAAGVGNAAELPDIQGRFDPWCLAAWGGGNRGTLTS